MKKKLLLFSLFTILMISVVNGALTDNLLEYWTFETPGDYLGELGKINGTSSFNVSSVSGKIGNALFIDAGFGSGVGLNDSIFGPGFHTISYWYYHPIDATYRGVSLGQYKPAVSYRRLFHHGITANAMTVTDSTGSSGCNFNTASQTMNPGAWNHIVFVQNSTNNAELWLNGVLASVDTTCQYPYQGTTTGLGATNGDLEDTGLNSSIDELAVWGVILTHDQIAQLYNGGSGFAYPFVVPDFTVNTDLIDGTKNYNDPDITINYNVTVSATSDIANCTLEVDGVLNQTDTNVNVSNNQNFYVSWGDAEKYFTFEIECDNGVDSDSSGLFQYNVDTIVPRITTGFVNETTVNKQLDPTLEFEVEFYDPNLYAYNVTLKNSTGFVYNNTFQENLNATNTTTINVTQVYDTYFLGVDSYTIEATVWDSHTDNIIYWDAYDLGNGYEYDDNVQIWADNLVGYNKNKLTDRFTFEFTLSGNPNDYKAIHLESTQPLQYVGNQYGYDNHFIDISNNKWIDFVSQDVEDSYVEKIDDKHYIVWVKSVSGNRFRFESIGDLNTRTKVYNFDVDPCAEDWQPYYTACSIGDNETLLYNDDNSCGNSPVFIPVPLDNGTVTSTCNYCTLQTNTEQTACLESFEQITYYVYDNFGTCCNVTGLASDCDLPANVSNACVGVYEAEDTPLVVFDILIKILVFFVSFVLLIGLVFLIGWAIEKVIK